MSTFGPATILRYPGMQPDAGAPVVVTDADTGAVVVTSPASLTTNTWGVVPEFTAPDEVKRVKVTARNGSTTLTAHGYTLTVVRYEGTPGGGGGGVQVLPDPAQPGVLLIFGEA